MLSWSKDDESPPSYEATVGDSNANLFNVEKITPTATNLAKTRNIKHSLSNTRTFLNLAKALVGTGVLSLAAAFCNAGLWVGSGLTIAMLYVNVHCSKMLLDASRHFCIVEGREFLDFHETAEESAKHGPPAIRKFSKSFRYAVSTALFVAQIGFCCAYVAFFSENIKQVVDIAYPDNYLDVRVYVAALFLPVLALAMLRELKFLAPLAFVTNITNLVGFGIIFYYIMQDLPPLSDRAAYRPISTFPLFFGTVMFSYEAVCVILAMENRMKEPAVMTAWNGILYTVSGVVCALYVAMGFYGYLKFGDAAKDKGTITLNLPESPLYLSVRILFSLGVYVSYGLQLYVPVQIVRQWLEKRYEPRKALALDYVSRVFFVVLTFALAAAVPHVDLFISLVGSLAGASLGMIFTPLIDIFTRSGPNAASSGLSLGKFSWRLWKNIGIMILGIAGFISGTYSSLKQIVDTFG